MDQTENWPRGGAPGQSYQERIQKKSPLYSRQERDRLVVIELASIPPRNRSKEQLYEIRQLTDALASSMILPPMLPIITSRGSAKNYRKLGG
jgi:hypothetical protein